jgi:uncharacterized protein with HEPN domain
MIGCISYTSWIALIAFCSSPLTARILSWPIATQDAVLRNLHTLSESIQRISTDTKFKYPKVPWREISAFRNVVVHDYLGIELERIWDIVERDLPPLKIEIQSIVDEFL